MGNNNDVISEVEIWKPVKGYEGKYEISSTGRLKSLERVDLIGRTVPERIITPKQCTNKYLYYALSQKGVKQQKRVHRVVAEMFIPNPENKPQVNHINGQKHDNRVENLEWVTIGENNSHAIQTGLRDKLILAGEENAMSKLTEDAVRFIRLNRNNYSRNDLCNMFRVGKSSICAVLKNRTWKHVK